MEIKATKKFNIISAICFTVYSIFFFFVEKQYIENSYMLEKITPIACKQWAMCIFASLSCILLVLGFMLKKKVIILSGFACRIISLFFYSSCYILESIHKASVIIFIISEVCAVLLIVFSKKLIARILCFVPAILHVWANVKYEFGFFPRPHLYKRTVFYEYSLLFGIIYALALLIGCIYIAFPNGITVKTNKKEYQFSSGTSVWESGYIGLAKHVILLLITFGIWNLIWIYRTTDYLNNSKNEEFRNPTTKLLLCMFVPFYSIYWTYKSAQRIDNVAKEQKITSDLSTLCLILAIFIPIIPPILLQSKINDIATGNNKIIVPTDTADELKKYKDLFDSGIITQEEFDAKKKQLLGL